MAQTRDSIQVEFRFGHVVLDGRPLASVWLGDELGSARAGGRGRDGARGSEDNVGNGARDIDRALERMLDLQIRQHRGTCSISFRREGGRVLWTRTADGLHAVGELTA